MFVTPQHKVKELRDEAGWNIVSSTMLCSEFGGGVGGGGIGICRKKTKRVERRKSKEGGQGGERKRRNERERKGSELVYVSILS